jgi:hypothetical protein
MSKQSDDWLWRGLLLLATLLVFIALAFEQDKLNARIRQLELRAGLPDPWAEK